MNTVAAANQEEAAATAAEFLSSKSVFFPAPGLNLRFTEDEFLFEGGQLCTMIISLH